MFGLFTFDFLLFNLFVPATQQKRHQLIIALNSMPQVIDLSLNQTLTIQTFKNLK
jgi:hypothetical protein